jgi:hypothetical protein
MEKENPTKKKPIYAISRVEKVAKEDMEIMMGFLKKHIQGRIFRKLRNVNEFIEDIGYYFLQGQTKNILS